jgi:deazaflavin-dependent oxidoreductase (nitroreductase family)
MGFYHQVIDGFARTRAGGWMFLHVFNPIDKRLLRWTNGAIGTGLGTEFAPNGVLLRCVGKKTGKPRDIPLLATPLDGGWVLIASATGQQQNPAWYHNLKANPRCDLLVRGRGQVACVAREVEGAERDRAWAAANAQYSGYDVSQTRTPRRIPVMVLMPRTVDE